ncbi:putative uncharacterized protein DDB_G0282499 [Episyrphus balteatus]|uniref:putative uncharacterized protein DDB_G0282499 n=1 Tax=Episyrphus balteatus TaxID=286459 RepID=UPI0024859CC8|nr:putative uncharacterized protein DDB_G0282499 [Episyrphus balteatus]
MITKNNDMFGGSSKRLPQSARTSPLRSLAAETSSSSTTTATPQLLRRTEQKSQYLLSRTFLSPPPSFPPTPTQTKAPVITKIFPLTTSTLPRIAVNTTITSKSISEPLPSRIVSSSPTVMEGVGDRSTEQISSTILSGRTKLLQQYSRHRQIQQQQYHHLHHHHHHTPQFRFRILPGLKATSFFTILTLVCLETVLLSTVSNCAKTFYMHWNTSNSIFRIDNTDHIIDVNKGNLAFEFDQVHIICPVYEPGTFENETEKYIIYNVSKVEYETCRITNADPRVIAICDKPQRLMFFTITFRPFTPQPGGLEFLPGNDYYFISTSSKDDLYRRIGGRCSTNNMKVVFKVCCAPEDKNNRTNGNMGGGNGSSGGGGGGGGGGIGNNGVNGGNSGSINSNTAIQQQQHNNNININGGGQMPLPKLPGMGGGGIGIGMNNGGGGGGLMINGNSGTSINTNIDQYNRIPMQQPNNIGNGNMGMNGIGVGGGGINGINGQHPTGIRINNVPSSQQHPSQKNGMHGGYIAPMANINTNSSNVVQSTINWPDWGNHNNNHNGNQDGSDPGGIDTQVSTIGIHPHFYPPHKTSPRPNLNSAAVNNSSSNYSPSHKPTKKTNDYDKHPNEVVKNEELTYNSAAPSLYKLRRRRVPDPPNEETITPLTTANSKGSWRFKTKSSCKNIYQKFKSLLQLLLYTSNHRNRINTIHNFINFISNCNPIILTTTVLVTLINLFQYKLSSSWSVMRLCYSSSTSSSPSSSKVPPPTRTSSIKLTPKFSSSSSPKKKIYSPVDCCIVEALR